MSDKNEQLQRELKKIREGKEEIVKLAELKRLAESRAKELERTNQVMVGRELMMIDLKARNKKLEAALAKKNGRGQESKSQSFLRLTPSVRYTCFL